MWVKRSEWDALKRRVTELETGLALKQNKDIVNRDARFSMWETSERISLETLIWNMLYHLKLRPRVQRESACEVLEPREPAATFFNIATEVELAPKPKRRKN